MSFHNRFTLVVSALLVALGLAIIVRTALLGGGAGFFFGGVVLAAGVGRLYFGRT